MSLDTDSNSPKIADSEFFLGLYRTAVKFYQPKIEQKTGITLGEIKVWHYDHVVDHQLRDYVREHHYWPFRQLIFSISKKSWKANACKNESGRNIAASYYNRAIYVHFSSDVSHEHNIATVTMHELSHALWDSLAKTPIFKSQREITRQGEEQYEKYISFVEGFAMYAQREYFKELYPQPVAVNAPHYNLDIDTPYERGFRLVKKLIKQYGPQIFLEIPERWRSFL